MFSENRNKKDSLTLKETFEMGHIMRNEGLVNVALTGYIANKWCRVNLKVSYLRKLMCVDERRGTDNDK